MSYDIDEFVNVRARDARRVNIYESLDLTDEQLDEATDEQLFEEFPRVFAREFEYDFINTSASPVLVFELAGVPVAYYDAELFEGRIV